MASPSSWIGALVNPSQEAMKIVNNNNINNSDNNSCPIPLPNELPPKIVEFCLPPEHNNTMDDCATENHNNSIMDNFLSPSNGLHNHHHNDFDNDENDDKHHPLPRPMRKVSREEYPARRHPSIDLPFIFPPSPHSNVNTELDAEDLKAHLQLLSNQTVPQQKNRPSRKSGRQEAEYFLKEQAEDTNKLNMGDNFFSMQPVVSQWIDHTYYSLPEPKLPMGVVTEKTDDEEMEKCMKASDLPFLVRQHLVQVENRLFEMFGDKERQTININKFLMGLMATGLRHDDPRLKELRKNLKKVQERLSAADPQALDVNYDTFMGIISDNLEIVVKAFSSSFVIPDFKGFCTHIDEIYSLCQANREGKVASYIPQLARSNSDHWGVSICTVDGQRYSLGDVNVPFTVQSCSKPLNYAMALGMTSSDYIHEFVGMEPSGRYFNELCLDYSNKPHNPMINAGAIMTAALIKPNLSAADRFDYVFNLYKRLTAGEYLGFNNAVFLSERECADRNFALAYFMRENKCFPEGTRLHETLDFYFQLCSMEITAESGAIIAATLANGGINPLTGDPVLTVEAVRNVLTLMHSCGMYNYSGQFAFKVGLPSKSGVSGCVLVVVPNTMGFCLWSPPLDSNGNSCRSVQFCMELVSRFTFHNFDNLRGHITTKTDPRVAKAESKAQILFDLLFSAAAGDLSALRRHSLSGTDMEAKDYDGRTALHVAASEGHYSIVEYLLRNCQVNPLPKDRWDRTPLDDARSFGHPRCASLISESCIKRGISLPPPPPPLEEEVKTEKE